MEFGYGYPDFPEAQWKIEKLNLSIKCYNALKRTGIEYVGDLLDVYARYRLDPMTMSWLRIECISPVFRNLIAIEDCPWHKEIEEWVVKWIEK